MANISDYLRKILEARYGRDVRGSIHDAISAINEEAVEAVNNSAISAQSAQLSAESANKASSDVAAIKTDIYDTAIPAINQAVADSQAAQVAAETAKEGAETARTDTEALEAQCKIYKDKCENATAGITGGLIPKGTTEYANLPSLEDASVGWLFYISDDFVTTSEFIEGEGFYYPPGTNAYVISVDGTKYWDCMGGEMSGYLMKNDFDSTLADAKPEFEEATELKVSSGITSVKNLFANVAKIIKVLGSTDLSKVGDDISSIIKGLSDKIGSTDISGVGDGSVTGAVSVLNSNFKNLGNCKSFSDTSKTSIPTSSFIQLPGTLTLEKGVWIIHGKCNFAPNENGVRTFYLSVDGDSSSVDISGFDSNPLSNNSSDCFGIGIIEISNDTSIVSMHVAQTSGASLTLNMYAIKATRIGIS